MSLKFPTFCIEWNITVKPWLKQSVCCALDTKFKQQKLPAWQPILTAGTVLPLLFAIGVGFIPIGIAFLITANNVCTYRLIVT